MQGAGQWCFEIASGGGFVLSVRLVAPPAAWRTCGSAASNRDSERARDNNRSHRQLL
jgi:hypothetical protein